MLRRVELAWENYPVRRSFGKESRPLDSPHLRKRDVLLLRNLRGGFDPDLRAVRRDLVDGPCCDLSVEDGLPENHAGREPMRTRTNREENQCLR